METERDNSSTHNNGTTTDENENAATLTELNDPEIEVHY